MAPLFGKLRGELQRKDAILLNMTEAMKAIAPPAHEEASQSAEVSPETPGEGPEESEPRAEQQEGVQRPWWRRLFGA
jgi:hypothetical protein